jgi:ATP-dependent helicase HrpB
MSSLPIESCLGAIGEGLPPGGSLLLQAPPGAGKTTRVPLALLDAWGDQAGSILMLEPRRLAAKAAAERLAASLNEPVGERVGYRVRFEQRCSAATRIEVVTDGLFLRRLQADPGLEGVACVIFDEFHERRSEADLALALVREARSVLAPDLRLLVMSATLNLAPLASQWPEAQQVTSEGRSYPVAVTHQAPRPQESLANQLLRALEQHWLDQRQPGETVLVFLPGQREIQQCQRALDTPAWAQELEICPLHGSLPLAAQSQALAAARRPAGKLVLASAIAESSLTLQGVSLVIDSGLSRRSRFDPRTGMDALVTGPASQASAEQRRGRAGRLGPGRCIRLWSAADQQGRPAFDPPELLEADPAPLVLQLAQWGAGLGEALPWLDPPPRANLQEGQALLQTLGAVDGAGALTGHGRQLAGLGVHPRLGQLLLRSRALGAAELGSALATLLSERDPLNPQSEGSDLGRRLDWLRQPGRDPQRQRLLQLQRQLLAQLQALGPIEPPKPQADPAGPGRPKESRSKAPEATQAPETVSWSPDALAGELVAHAYPDWVALRRPEAKDRYLTRGAGAPNSVLAIRSAAVTCWPSPAPMGPAGTAASTWPCPWPAPAWRPGQPNRARSWNWCAGIPRANGSGPKSSGAWGPWCCSAVPGETLRQLWSNRPCWKGWARPAQPQAPAPACNSCPGAKRAAACSKGSAWPIGTWAPPGPTAATAPCWPTSTAGWAINSRGSARRRSCSASIWWKPSGAAWPGTCGANSISCCPRACPFPPAAWRGWITARDCRCWP